MSEQGDRAMVTRLLKLNPFGGYRLPRDEREREILRKTLANYEARSVPVSPPAHGVPGARQHEQHEPDDEQDDPDREQDRDLGHEQPDDDQDDAENDHGR